jgi:Na+-transporting NADH:ubiquinone oxidoreductase subunit B
MLEKVEPHFEKGGKWEKLHPVYDGLATFMFTPKHTAKNGVHVKDGIDLKRTMTMVILALIPCLLFGMYNTGHQHYLALGENINPGDAIFDKFFFGLLATLPLIIVSYGVGLGVEFIFCIIKGHAIQEGFLVSGMLIPLVMPIDVPLWMVAVATIFAVVIGKEVFGGTGMNILNVALTARAFLFFAHPTKMSGSDVWIGEIPRDSEGLAATEKMAHYGAVHGDKMDVVNKAGEQIGVVDKNTGAILEGVDAFSGATPLGDLASTIALNKDVVKWEDKIEAIGSSDPETVTNLTESIAQNKDQISGIMDNLPDFWDAFFGFMPGSIGETSAFACLLGAGLLLFTGIGSWRIMLSMLLGGLSMGLIFNAFSDVNPFFTLPAHMHLVYGGFAFGMVFMATDPVTAAQTNRGKWIYGFLAGFLAIMIRVFNPAYPEGVMMAILFMNVMAPLIDHYVIQGNVKRRMKRAKLAAA